jgi:uncharacterized protein YjbI with pentapeptide repeats
MVARLEQLHQWLIAEGWRYSDSFALSNIVSVLAFLGRFRVQDATYAHCNLRNAFIVNGALIERSLFHGVDFAGARIHGAKITDGKFYGVDFTSARFEDTELDGTSRFVGCRFDNQTLTKARCGPNVRFIESIPEEWQPPSNQNGE